MPLPWLFVYFLLLLTYFLVFSYINYLGSLEKPFMEVPHKSVSVESTSINW